MTAYLATWFTRPQEESQDRKLATISLELAEVRALLVRVAGPAGEAISETADSRRIGMPAAEESGAHPKSAVIAALDVQASG